MCKVASKMQMILVLSPLFHKVPFVCREKGYKDNNDIYIAS